MLCPGLYLQLADSNLLTVNITLTRVRSSNDQELFKDSAA